MKQKARALPDWLCAGFLENLALSENYSLQVLQPAQQRASLQQKQQVDAEVEMGCINTGFEDKGSRQVSQGDGV